jgi:histone H2B
MSDVKPTEIAKKAHNKKRVESYSTYVLKVLKAVSAEDKQNADVGVSKRCMEAMNSLVTDLFERIATEAATLARKAHRNTIGKKEVESATKLVLTGGELCKQAMDYAAEAVSKYSSDKEKK